MGLASLPWYELPETCTAQDALWAVLAAHLERQGIRDVPPALTRGVPVVRLLGDPDLLVGQCCGYDLIYGFAASVALVATPRYDAPGCEGANYRSLVLVREDSRAGSLQDLYGLVCAINSFNSHSGANALRAAVAALSRNGRFFSAVKVSGAHVASLAMVKAGEADAMAMDCVLHALLSRHRPSALDGIRAVAWTAAAPAPPLVTAAAAGGDRVGRLRQALTDAFADPRAAEARAALLWSGVAFRPLADYARIVELEGEALKAGYTELHATSPVLAG